MKNQAAKQAILTIEKLRVCYGDKVAIPNLSLDIFPGQVTALIGPSGCGKSTLLRCLNRMNDFIPGVEVTGSLTFQGQNILDDSIDEVKLRTTIGMVFQKPNPFPRSVSENIAWGLRMHNRSASDDAVELALRQAYLWNEVKEKLDTSALSLSGGQQQRLCIARALALQPQVLLMDEPCSALDPIATQRIEELITSIKERCTVVIVTHNLAQARRVSDQTLFLEEGEIVEMGPTQELFANPRKERTADYVNGRFG